MAVVDADAEGEAWLFGEGFVVRELLERLAKDVKAAGWNFPRGAEAARPEAVADGAVFFIHRDLVDRAM